MPDSSLGLRPRQLSRNRNLELISYRKHRRISRTFLLKIFVSNWGCGLSARTSEDHAVNLHKLTLFSKNDKNSTWLHHSTFAFASLVAPVAKRAVFVHINRLNVAFLEQLNVTRQRSFFHQKVVYIAAVGRGKKDVNYVHSLLRLHFRFILISFQIFFQNLSSQTWGAAYLRVRLIRRCLR